MNEEQQNKCVALLLAIAFYSGNDAEILTKAAKKFLAKLPQEVVAKAAGSPYQF